jgi:hypothetical protein
MCDLRRTFVALTRTKTVKLSCKIDATLLEENFIGSWHVPFQVTSVYTLFAEWNNSR